MMKNMFTKWMCFFRFAIFYIFIFSLTEIHGYAISQEKAPPPFLLQKKYKKRGPTGYPGTIGPLGPQGLPGPNGQNADPIPSLSRTLFVDVNTISSSNIQ